MPDAAPYLPRRAPRSRFVALRGLRHHLSTWSDDNPAAAAQRPLLVMLHGWMDIGASFQFVVDAFSTPRRVVAPDWRGFGLTAGPATDCYWYPDYLGDLDALLDALSPEAPVDLVGHSMGGNVAMLYAGVRPARVRRLANLEGFGLPDTAADEAPQRYARWLDELKAPVSLAAYDSLQAVAARLRKTNPRLPPDKAMWLAERWSQPDEGGRRTLRADPAHKRVNPQLYRQDEVLACWRRIEAPVLWLEGEDTELHAQWGGRYRREVFEQRLAQVGRVERERLPGCGHMLHHDQPQALAARLERFLG